MQITASLKITKITILQSSHHHDTVLFETNLPNPEYPYSGFAVLQLHVASLEAKAYVRRHFAGMDFTVIHV